MKTILLALTLAALGCKPEKKYGSIVGTTTEEFKGEGYSGTTTHTFKKDGTYTITVVNLKSPNTYECNGREVGTYTDKLGVVIKTVLKSYGWCLDEVGTVKKISRKVKK